MTGPPRAGSTSALGDLEIVRIASTQDMHRRAWRGLPCYFLMNSSKEVIFVRCHHSGGSAAGGLLESPRANSKAV